MTDPASTPADPGLKHLEGKSFEALLAWLESALRSLESLPRVVPDESPEDPILRRERSLNGLTRDDLREACRTLVRRFVRSPGEDDDYVGALLRLAKGFNLKELASDLHGLAAQGAVFAGLPKRQQRTILFTLLDLQAPLPLEFWKGIAVAYPQQLGVIAVSGLLGHGYHSALQVVASLPEGRTLANSLYIVLDQHARLINPTELQQMVEIARQTVPQCAPSIRAALGDWISEHDKKEATTEDSNPRYSALETALAARAALNGAMYIRRPRPAGLIAA